MTSMSSGIFSSRLQSVIYSAGEHGPGKAFPDGAMNQISVLRTANVVSGITILVNAPTSKPTSSMPTSVPTKHPTTSKPTIFGETNRPTPHPVSRRPTSRPTGKPSGQPTGTPTRQPTSNPTHPTALPTSTPTYNGLQPFIQSTKFAVAIGLSIGLLILILGSGYYFGRKILIEREKQKKLIPVGFTAFAELDLIEQDNVFDEWMKEKEKKEIDDELQNSTVLTKAIGRHSPMAKYIKRTVLSPNKFDPKTGLRRKPLPIEFPPDEFVENMQRRTTSAKNLESGESKYAFEEDEDGIHDSISVNTSYFRSLFKNNRVGIDDDEDGEEDKKKTDIFDSPTFYRVSQKFSPTPDLPSAFSPTVTQVTQNTSVAVTGGGFDGDILPDDQLDRQVSPQLKHKPLPGRNNPLAPLPVPHFSAFGDISPIRATPFSSRYAVVGQSTTSFVSTNGGARQFLFDPLTNTQSTPPKSPTRTNDTMTSISNEVLPLKAQLDILQVHNDVKRAQVPASRINKALVYLKPAAATPLASPKCLYAVSSTMTAHCIRIMSTGKVHFSNEAMVKSIIESRFKKLIYYAEKAKPVDYWRTDITAANLTQFMASFNISWEDAMEHNLIINAAEALTYFQTDGAGLYRMWQDSTMCIQLSRGLSIAAIDIGLRPTSPPTSPPKSRSGSPSKELQLEDMEGGDDKHTVDEATNNTTDEGSTFQPKKKKKIGLFAKKSKNAENEGPPKPKFVYVINGFCYVLKEQYINSISTYGLDYVIVEWDSKKLSWSTFLDNVIGDRDPTKASSESIRGSVLANWEEYGLSERPSLLDNICHASHSAFEGLSDRLRWLKDTDVLTDTFGSRLCAPPLSIPAKVVYKWTMQNPLISPSRGLETSINLLFPKRVLEIMDRLDVDECIAIAAKLYTQGRQASPEKASLPSPLTSLPQFATPSNTLSSTRSLFDEHPLHSSELMMLENSIEKEPEGTTLSASPKLPALSASNLFFDIPSPIKRSAESGVFAKRNTSVDSALIVIKPLEESSFFSDKLADFDGKMKYMENIISHLEYMSVRIVKRGSVSKKQFQENGIFESMFGHLTAKALTIKPETISMIPEHLELFSKTFGTTWEKALEEGKLMNAYDACKILIVDNKKLFKWWSEAESMIRFDKGFHCAKILLPFEYREMIKPPKKVETVEDSRSRFKRKEKVVDNGEPFYIYVVNGFYETLVERYSVPDLSVDFLVVEWDSNTHTWRQFLDNVIGDRDPTYAFTTSLRGAIYKNFKNCGLVEPPSLFDNIVRVSGSALEAMHDRQNFLSDHLFFTDLFGSRLLKERVQSAVLKKMLKNPFVEVPRKVVDGIVVYEEFKGLLFDALRGLGSDECIDLLSHLQLIPPK